MSLYCLALCIWIIVASVKNNLYFTHYLAEIVIGAFGLFFSFPLSRLTIYHLIIISKRQTTNENLKNTYDKKIEVPYSSCYRIKRDNLFDNDSTYVMNRNFESSSSKNSRS